MKTQVEFRSSKFPPYDGEEDEINPGVWGRRLAEYLAQRLAEKGIRTEEPFAEDWGWFVPIEDDDVKLAICCGHQDGEDDEFVCLTEPAKPIVRKLFRKVDLTSSLTRLVEAIDEILSSDADIRDVRWIEPG